MFALDADLMRQLRATFKGEAEEHIQVMNRVLLNLEKKPDEKEKVELLEEIFRAAHSLKGASGAVDLGDVESTAHRLESVLYAAKTGEIELTSDACDVLYKAIDSINLIINTSLVDEPHGVDLDALHAQLDAAQHGEFLPIVQQVQETPEPILPEQEEIHPEVQAAQETVKPAVVDSSVKSSAPQPPAPSTAAQDNKKRQRRNGSGPALEETVRVTTGKLDSLMTQAGELLVAGLKIDQRLQEVEALVHASEEWNREWLKVRTTCSMLLREDGNESLRPLLKFLDYNQQNLKNIVVQMGDLWRSFSSDTLHLSRVTDDLGSSVMKVRMLPVSTVFDTFPRMVRDISRERDKEIDLIIKGGDTELDRKVLEEIKDPLIHILRNAVDHGIETPDKRESAGKPRQGTIVVSASQKGNNIVIQVKDDGGGINVQKVKESALKSGAIGPESLETMSDDEAMRLIFFSGVSTSPIITGISGRGVGMDVVRRNIESLHGHVEVESTLGEGTEMTMTLPLTLATTQELLVQVSGQTLGIPISAVEKIMRIQREDISSVEGKEAILVGDEPISLVHLANVLELERQEQEVKLDQKMPVIILGAGKWRIAFLVDAVVGQQESVVKSLGKQLERVRNVAGATILGTGQVIMTLNPTDLLKSARGVKGISFLAANDRKAKAAKAEKNKILVVDDSLTTRNLEKTILETAGYHVQVATDGMEAINILESNGNYDLILSDVLMPRMDGFDLTASVRQDPKLKDIPVVLVTSLESRKDKERGIEVGANAYFIKSTFDQKNLLEMIEQLI